MIYDKNPDFTLDNSKIKNISYSDVNYHVQLKEVLRETITYIKNHSTNGEDEEYNLITDSVLLSQVDHIQDEVQRRQVRNYINKLPSDYLVKLNKFKLKRELVSKFVPLKKLGGKIKVLLLRYKNV